MFPGKNLGFILNGFALLLILIGFLSIPGISSAITQGTGPIPGFSGLTEWVRTNAITYLGIFLLTLTILLVEKTSGFGIWTIHELRHDWRQLSIAFRLPLMLLGLVLFLYNLEIILLSFLKMMNLGEDGRQFYEQQISPWIHPGPFSLSLPVLNVVFLSLVSISLFARHLRQPKWRRIQGGDDLEASPTMGHMTRRLPPRNRELLRRAEKQIEKGKYVKAAKTFEAMGSDFYYRAGKLYDENGLPQEARHAFQKAGDHFAKNGNLVRAADAYFFGGAWEKALSAYQNANPQAQFGDSVVRTREWGSNWGETLVQLSRHKEAASIFKRFRLFKKAGEAFENAGMHTQAAEAYSSAGAFANSAKALSDGGYDNLAQLEKGKLKLQQSDYLGAGKAFESGGALQLAAEAYQKAEKPALAARCFFALERFEQAVELYLAAGEETQALECYEHLQDFSRAARLAGHLGLREKQAEYFRKSGQFVPAARAYLVSGRLSEAIACLQELPLTDEKIVNECLQILSILKEQERPREVLACAYGLLENRPLTRVLAPVVYLLGQTHQGMGNLEKAARHFQKAALLRPENADYVQVAKQMAGQMGEAFSIQVIDKDEDQADAMTQHDYADAETVHHPNPTRAYHAPQVQVSENADETTLTLDEHTIYDLTNSGTLSRYQVIKELGRGGMGFVYKAMDKKLKRLVALKMLHPELNKQPGIVLFFKREAMAIAQLNHPNIVQLFDMGKERGCFYMIIEYVEGHTLKSLLERYQDFLDRNLIPIWYQTCVGLRYAHGRGILHRDLKPSNLMWSRERRLKILDFGLAKEITDLNQTQQVWGTPSFMAPEMLQGERATFQTDIYGMGATFYMLATGKAPFGIDESGRKFTGSGLPEPPHRLRAGLSKALSDIIQRCLYQDPTRRFSTVDELMAELKRIGRNR